MVACGSDLNTSRFVGCVLGLASGDALGAPYEGGVLERTVWRLIGRTPDGCARYTDDTQMSLDLAVSLLARGGVDQDDLAGRFAASYAWRRGYGPSAARLLKRIRGGEDWRTAVRAIYPQGSFGNGAAMRSPIVALYFVEDFPAMVIAARAAAEVTHAHPLGIEGAVMLAVGTHALLGEAPALGILDAVVSHCVAPEMLTRLAVARGWLASEAAPAPAEVARTLGHGMTAATSCVTALYLALRHLDADFDSLMRFIIACKGDVDTLGAMAGALWGARNGEAGLPDFPLEGRAHLVDLAQRLHTRRTMPVERDLR